MSRHHVVADVPILTTLAGDPMRALDGETKWDLEDREDSTNRLTLTVPLADAADIVTDAEVIFRGRRFKILEVNQGRASGTSDITADEAQVELSDLDHPAYKLNGSTLSAALTKALAGSLWKSAGVHDDTGTYFADFENESISRVLRFLQSQSKQWMRFDSMNRTVDFVDDAPPPLDRVLTYGVGVTDVVKNSTAPAATVIEPTGRGGMTITEVNGGKSSVEDFSWYTGLGISLTKARARFTKKQFWQDDRYVYAMNLKRDAQARLALLSQPQINYKVSAASGLADGLRLGDRVWVVDEELGVKLATRVVRVLTSNDAAQNQIELDYLPRSFGSIRTDAEGDSTPGGTDMVQFQVKNEEVVTLGDTPARVLASTVQVIADTAFQVGVVVRVKLGTAALVEGYFQLDGVRIDPEIRQDAGAGWVTFGLPFLVTQVTEGSKNFDLYMLLSNGSAVVPVHGAEMFIVTRAALGGVDNRRPDRSVTEHIGQWFRPITAPADNATVWFPAMLSSNPSEHLGEWFTSIPVPTAHGVAMFKPEVAVTGGVVAVSGMIPGQVFTLRFDSVQGTRVGEDAFTADTNGKYTLDLVAEFAIPVGAYTVTDTGFGQTIDFTVEDSTW